jgi:hypothetical protein
MGRTLWAVVVTAGLVGCGSEPQHAQYSAAQESAQAVPQQAPLPACLADGRALLGASPSQVEACAGPPCSVVPASQNGTLSDVWRYCLDGCGSACAREATVHFYQGRVTAVATPNYNYRGP